MKNMHFELGQIVEPHTRPKTLPEINDTASPRNNFRKTHTRVIHQLGFNWSHGQGVQNCVANKHKIGPTTSTTTILVVQRPHLSQALSVYMVNITLLSTLWMVGLCQSLLGFLGFIFFFARKISLARSLPASTIQSIHVLPSWLQPNVFLSWDYIVPKTMRCAHQQLTNQPIPPFFTAHSSAPPPPSPQTNKQTTTANGPMSLIPTTPTDWSRICPSPTQSAPTIIDWNSSRSIFIPRASRHYQHYQQG